MYQCRSTSRQTWLDLTPRDKLPKPAREAFPRPSKRPDGSYIYERVPNAAGADRPYGSNHPQMLYKKRPYEEKEIASIVPHKVQRTSEVTPTPATATAHGGGRTHVPNVVPPKGRVATLTRIQGGQKQIISWMDAPDDVYFRSTPSIKRARKRLPIVYLRRAARKPFKKVLVLP